MALRQRFGDGHDGEAGVPLGERLVELLDRLGAGDDATGGDDLVERRERVARRPATLVHDPGDRLFADVEIRVGDDPADLPFELVSREQLELEVLGPALDGRQDLLRVGRREHEADVVRWLLERLQQGVGRARRQHVDLVQDVHLGPAGRADGGALDQVADGVDAVVGGGVELEEVEAAAGLHVLAWGALAARLALLEVLAVEGLGEDAGRRRLAGAAGAREQIGVALALVAHRVAQCADDVLLAADLVEAPRSVPPVEGLVGHGSRSYRRAPTRSPAGRAAVLGDWRPGRASRCRSVSSGGDQAICGTPQVPLRAAAFRP